MNNQYYGWTIYDIKQNKFVNIDDNEDPTYYEELFAATFTWSKHRAEYFIEAYELDNCIPVKVKMIVVKESKHDKKV